MSRPVVLIADDDQEVALLLRTYLRPLECDIVTARDGEEALSLAQARLPDVVLLDVIMPKRSGWEVCQALKAVQRTSHIGVILVTGRGDVKDRLTGLQVGADDYLVKPFDLPELLARVHALIRRAEMRHQDVTLNAGPITLDPLKRRVTCSGRVVDLSPREFTLLEFLMRNADRTVSRSRIAEAVWNYKFDPETNVVDVYVKYLRKKLNLGGVNVAIRTVRGVGYRLDTGSDT